MSNEKNTVLRQLANYTIDAISDFTQAVRGLTGIRIGGVFTYNNVYRTANLINNPTEIRYGGEIPLTPAGGEFIGERYNVESKLLPNKNFIDSIGGLKGFTDGGYVNTINTNVRQNMAQSIKNAKESKSGQEDNIRSEKLNNSYSTNDENTKNTIGLKDYHNISKNPGFENLDRLKNYDYIDSGVKELVDDVKNREKKNEKYSYTTESAGTLTLSEYYEIGDVKEGTPHPLSGLTKDKKYDKLSADNPSAINSSNNKDIVTIGDNNKLIGATYELYNEDGELDTTINTTSGSSYFKEDTYGKINKDNKTNIIKKTNELFKNKKIGSMISRFYRSEDKELSLTQNATDKEYGVSRGRNLLKKNPKTDKVTSFGYYDPYCRVWTAHYQYSKMDNLIRHKGFSESGYSKLFDNKSRLRPNNAIERLAKLSTLQVNGLPKITSTEEDVGNIKKYMFSIENLAWRDIKLDAGVDESGCVLSKEQRGPNGGRIMWFPPYNLKFSESVNVNWNTNNFIGRGEPIYTYTNTERSGTLSFTILVDHPSVIDSWTKGLNYDGNTEAEKKTEAEKDLLRFFAGCDVGSVVKETNNTDSDNNVNGNNNTNNINNNRGNNDIPKNNPKPQKEDLDVKLRYFVFFPNNFSGVDFYRDGDTTTPINYLWSGAYSGGTGYEVNENPNAGIGGCVSSSSIKGGETREGEQAYWYYQVDNDKRKEKLYSGNYKDTASFGLNKEESFRERIKDSNVRIILNIDENDIENTYTLSDLLNTDFRVLDTFFGDKTSGNTPGNIQDSEFELMCFVKGYASSHGKISRNAGEDGLAMRRAKFLKKYLENREDLKFIDNENIIIEENGVIEVGEDNRDVSSLSAKLGRCAEVTVGLIRKNKKPNLNPTTSGSTVSEESRESTTIRNNNNNNTNVQTASTESTIDTDSHYDDEYRYFQTINDESDVIRRNLIEKVKYFDPAYHSITPEGFNARLTFLHQCTRQGPTMSASDMQGRTPMGAGNLSFGRPPVCILRIGDFFFTKIIIDSLQIDYENSQWDLNPEGVGIQPMLATINLGIKFLGGSDLSGPIARLQNAVSFNYYANASVYDRRADYRDDFLTEKSDKSQIWEPLINESQNNSTKHREYTLK